MEGLRRRVRPPATAALLLVLLLPLAACQHVQMLRPAVLSQLDRDVAALVNYLPEIDHPNEATLGRLIGTGGLVRAEDDGDGTLRARVRIPPRQLIWKPSVVVMPRGGTLELVFSNEDEETHQALLPSDGGKELLTVLPRTAGVARIELRRPGLYSFGCPVANHSGRGMIGLIVVEGDVPEEARPDRPPQPRPGE